MCLGSRDNPGTAVRAWVDDRIGEVPGGALPLRALLRAFIGGIHDDGGDGIERHGVAGSSRANSGSLLEIADWRSRSEKEIDKRVGKAGADEPLHPRRRSCKDKPPGCVDTAHRMEFPYQQDGRETDSKDADKDGTATVAKQRLALDGSDVSEKSGNPASSGEHGDDRAWCGSCGHLS